MLRVSKGQTSPTGTTGPTGQPPRSDRSPATLLLLLGCPPVPSQQMHLAQRTPKRKARNSINMSDTFWKYKILQNISVLWLLNERWVKRKRRTKRILVHSLGTRLDFIFNPMYGRGTFFLEIRLGKALRMESAGIAKPMPSPNKALMLIMPITSPTSFSLHSTRGPQTTNRIQIYIYR